MDARNAVSQKFVRLVDDVGQGAVIVSLRGEGAAVSKAAPILAHEFRVLSFAVASSSATEAADELAEALGRLGVTAAAIMAASATTNAALSLMAAHPQLVQSLALLAPPALDDAIAGRLSDSKTPVLALFGTRDTARPQDAARKFCRSIPHCSLMYVFDADRALDDERPEAVAAALREFAVKREKFIVTGKSGRLYP
jgi:pimeloyl-ACP methyl ester carboxylesterase